MQRLHDADLCGVELDRGGYCHLMIPLEYERKRAYSTGIGRFSTDPRTEDGEVMWKDRHTLAFVEKLKHDVAPFESSQLQQDPVPNAGGIFQRDWFKQFWATPEWLDKLPNAVPLPPVRELYVLQSWDCTFKGTDGSDFVVGQVWGSKRAQCYLLDEDRARRSYVETKEAIVRMSRAYPRAIRKLVEDKANGTAVIDDLKKDLVGLEPVEPEGGKEVRAHAVSPMFKAGNVILPHPDMPGFEWVRAYIEELCRFPKAPNDDRVDATSQALAHLQIHAPRWLEQMASYADERTRAEDAIRKAAAEQYRRTMVAARTPALPPAKPLEPDVLAKLREKLGKRVA
jgi:predicted phage terminase large subunit-like protein